MRVLVLASNYSYTTATALAHLLKMKNIEVVGVMTVTGIFKKKSFIGSAIYSLKQQGFRYTINKTVSFLKMKLRVLLPSIMRRNDHIYYSLDEIIKFKKFDHFKVTDINSSEAITFIKNLEPDIIFSLSFPYILKKKIIDLPRLGVINLHRSYLPKYRGGSPVFWVRANKANKTGFTIHHISDGPVDSGNILLQREIDINPRKDSHNKIMLRFCDLIPSALDELFEKINGKIPDGEKQNEEYATTFKKPNKSHRKKFKIWD